jgi:hypothetical protein
VTARRKEIGGAGSAIAVELSMDDAELAERVRIMLIAWPGIEIVDAEDGRMPQVRITDGAVELAPNVPVLVLTDASGVMDALQAGASAVLSERADGDILCTAIRAAAQGLTLNIPLTAVLNERRSFIANAKPAVALTVSSCCSSVGPRESASTDIDHFNSDPQSRRARRRPLVTAPSRPRNAPSAHYCLQDRKNARATQSRTLKCTSSASLGTPAWFRTNSI